MTEPVKRYNMRPVDGPDVYPEVEPDGDWVEYSDYARLEQELAKVKADRAACWAEFKVMTRSCLDAEKERAEQWGLRREAEADRDTKAAVIAELKDQRDAALQLLAQCQEHLDPHRDAVLWGAVCDALRCAPTK